MPCSSHPNLLEIQSATIKIQQPKQMSSVHEVTLSRSLLKFTKKEKKTYRLIRMIHVALGLLLTWPQNKMPYPPIHKMLLQRTRSRGRYTFMLKGTNRHTAHFQLATTSVVSSQFVGCFFNVTTPNHLEILVVTSGRPITPQMCCVKLPGAMIDCIISTISKDRVNDRTDPATWAKFSGETKGGRPPPGAMIWPMWCGNISWKWCGTIYNTHV